MRPFIDKLLPSILLLCLTLNAFGQKSAEELLGRLEVNQALYPPEDILSTKSIVLLSVPEVADRSEWMVLVDELQLFLAEEGIDAVAYIETELLFSQPNQVSILPKLFKSREIRNVILFTAKNEKSPVFLAMGSYNGEDTFFNKGDAFWARQGPALSVIKDELSAYFKTGARYRDNLLVNEHPEFFYPEVDLGIVAKSIPPKIASFKVAVEQISEAVYTKPGLASFRFDNFYKRDSFELALRDRGYLIQALVMDTTNNISLKDVARTNQELRRDGFQYELLYVTGPERLVYDWISFPDRPKPTDKVVHKFYLSDLRNNNIYVGKNWDASADWNTAFESFLAQVSLVIQENAN